jgi:hypothetical protein
MLSLGKQHHDGELSFIRQTWRERYEDMISRESTSSYYSSKSSDTSWSGLRKGLIIASTLCSVEQATLLYVLCSLVTNQKVGT